MNCADARRYAVAAAIAAVALLPGCAGRSSSGDGGRRSVRQQEPSPAGAPYEVIVEDLSEGRGGILTVGWSWDDDTPTGGFTVLRSTDGESWVEAAVVGPASRRHVDTDLSLSGSVGYLYRVGRLHDGTVVYSPAAGPISARGSWFNVSRMTVLVAALLFGALIVLFIRLAKAGRPLKVRPIAGIQAVEEAVGRATEQGKPVLYSPGLNGLSSISTLASLSILSRVAEKIAEYGTRLIMPNRDPIVMSVAQETVRESYTRAGRPDAFVADDIFYVTDEQFAYVAAVDGIMLRERPATNIYMGGFYAESLLLAETGASIGAIQIAGTDSEAQLPFFIAACDYTLIGEELYAAGAYMGRDPGLLGSLKGQDYAKGILIVLIVVGIVLSTIAAFTNIDELHFLEPLLRRG